MKKCLLLVFISLILLNACKKDQPETSSPTGFNSTQSGGLLISNEGNFSRSNSSLSYFSPNDITYNDIYRSVNGNPLGDVLNSMAIMNNKLYLVVNNSGKIVVCDPITIRQKKIITGLPSPRCMIQATSAKAYVTDILSNQIGIVDLINDTVTGFIQLPGWTEEMIVLNGKVYVANYNSDKIYCIDVATDMITDSITVARFGTSISSDSNGKIWLLCSGDYFTGAPAELYRIDPSTGVKEFSHTFPANDAPAKLRKNNSGSEVYLIDNGIVKMNVTDTIYPSQPMIPSNGRYLYALRLDNSGNIYTADAIDFSQSGVVYVYSPNGTELKRFKVGVGPGDFLLLP